MNPYAPLFSHPTDIAIVWVGVAAWLGIFTALLRKRFVANPIRSEQVCSAASAAFLCLAGVIMAIFAVGLVFLAWLKITSVFWVFWELFFLMSVVCVFRVLPFFAVGLMCWSLIGKWRASFSPRALKLTAACFAAIVIDAALFFWLAYAFAPNAV